MSAKSERLFCALNTLDAQLLAEAVETEDLSGLAKTTADRKNGGFLPLPQGKSRRLAAPAARRKKSRWHRAAALAACLLVLALGAALPALVRNRQRPVLQWSPQFAAQDYFAYNARGTAGAPSDTGQNVDLDLSAYYDQIRWFSDRRAAWEAAGTLPVLADWPLFDCSACYDADGGLLYVTFHWHRQGPVDPYGDLTLQVGHQEVPQIADCITVELDENGCIVPPAVTVTRRDGVEIVATGREGQDLSLTFQNDSGWYRIEGSWNDSYAQLTALLDWVWAHPVDLDAFPLAEGDVYTYLAHSALPEAFAGRLPDFAALGLDEGETCLTLKNGVPVSYEGHFALGEGEARERDAVHWCLTDAPDYYDLQAAVYTLAELDQSIVEEVLSNQSNLRFRWGDSCVAVYTHHPQLAWELVRQLQEPQTDA